ncbi:MAG: hypothetical protein P4N60_01035 [Verrucomicrobiae bacterium]|nr:hypothetical protein [Verrucomicrobiae bacterium]
MNTDNSALIVASFDNATCQVISLAATNKEASSLVHGSCREFCPAPDRGDHP